LKTPPKSKEEGTTLTGAEKHENRRKVREVVSGPKIPLKLNFRTPRSTDPVQKERILALR